MYNTTWSSLHKRLNETLCDELKGRITYFYTAFREAHDVPHCAAIRLDAKEMIRFKWIHIYEQEEDVSALIRQGVSLSHQEMHKKLKPAWDESGTYSGSDFY